MAEGALKNVFRNEPVEVLDRVPGRAMEGWRYRGPFDELPAQAGVEHRVIVWEKRGEADKGVSAEEGTGIVHIAPGCGKEDFDLSRRFGLAVVAPIDESGVYGDGYGPLTGRYAGDMARQVFASLREKGVLLRVADYKHSYPHCWRCKTEVLFRLVDEWFISMEELRPRMMRVVDTITWIPDFGREREQDRNPERELVRLQEAEQAHERPAVADLRRHSSRLRAGPNPAELAVDEAHGELDALPVGRRVEPAARAGRMGQRNHGGAVELVPAADARREPADPQQPPDREPAHGNDQPRTDDLELPLAPEPAQRLFVRRRRTVAASRGRPSWIAAGDGRAVERLVELVLLEREPAPQRLTRAAAPRPPFLALDDSRRLAVHVRALAGVDVPDRPRLERVPGLDAGTTAAEVALERSE